MKDDEDTNKEFDNHQNIEDNGDITDADDVQFVEDEEEKNPRDTIKKLREALKAAQKERQEYLQGWQRMKADAANAKRLEEEWRSEFIKFSGEKLITRLLPVLESFSLATANKAAWEALPKDWRLGMEHIHRELLNALSEHGLREIVPTVGEPFDPRQETAISSVPVEKKELDHSVHEVVQRGYALNGKILKPASVVVAMFEQK